VRRLEDGEWKIDEGRRMREDKDGMVGWINDRMIRMGKDGGRKEDGR
jgi:hypothetical protein